MENVKYTLKKLTTSDDSLGEFRTISERGEFVQISNDKSFRHLVYLEILPGGPRGNHYHEKREETYYIVSGKTKVILKDLDTESIEELMLETGHKLTVWPRCVHTFIALEPSKMIHFSIDSYVEGDLFRYILNEGK